MRIYIKFYKATVEDVGHQLSTSCQMTMSPQDQAIWLLIL
jgi:hypothetical protein